ncbi:DUF3085 domain-containing protein [Sinorhizobium saheli]|uniref:DUF3085 domain-containing protein n=1 Tax=Sinorhizobium saheli TaxID=36856 RepID=A0A178XWK8_SINSA|nr:DUF3085 domain-containing protein [Sinorhizobium saheli]MQW86387.1 DUF3085 domain-containing protein [Sinorhizobium saheli]OAP39689.1 hypothetical protein ATB98_05060 [Sinorhizobium saheli]
MFTFSITEVRAVLARGRADAAKNGGFRVPYHGISPDAHARAGLWLVGDEGVYVMSNGKLAEGQRPLVVHAEECDPKTNPHYWHYKRRYFGGDDGVEFIDAVELEQLIAAAPDATHLQITINDTSLSLCLIRR